MLSTKTNSDATMENNDTTKLNDNAINQDQ